MTDIEVRLTSLEQNYREVKQTLDMTLELATNVGKLYKTAPEHIHSYLTKYSSTECWYTSTTR